MIGARARFVRIAVLILPSVGGHGQALILYSDFPNGLQNFALINGANWAAAPFQPIVSTNLSYITVATFDLFSPDENQFTLTTDNSGVPGTPLESWSTSNPLMADSVSFYSTNHPVLTNGVQYWLVASANEPVGRFGAWYLSQSSSTTPEYFLHSENQGLSWSALTNLPDPAFAVVGANPASPIITNALAVNPNFTLNVFNGIGGRTYLTLESADPTAPYSQWQPVATNRLSATGPFTVTVTNAADTNSLPQYFVLKLE
jgi:hypothetical protein